MAATKRKKQTNDNSKQLSFFQWNLVKIFTYSYMFWLILLGIAVGIGIGIEIGLSFKGH